MLLKGAPDHLHSSSAITVIRLELSGSDSTWARPGLKPQGQDGVAVSCGDHWDWQLRPGARGHLNKKCESVCCQNNPSSFIPNQTAASLLILLPPFDELQRLQGVGDGDFLHHVWRAGYHQRQSHAWNQGQVRCPFTQTHLQKINYHIDPLCLDWHYCPVATVKEDRTNVAKELRKRGSSKNS